MEQSSDQCGEGSFLLWTALLRSHGTMASRSVPTYRVCPMPEPNQPNFGNIQSGPIRHASLSPELLALAASVFELIGPYLNTTLEQFEISLMRDSNPEDEIAIWASITAAWLDYHETHEVTQPQDEKKLLAALILITTGVDDADALGVPPDVGRKLLACYDALGNDSDG
jgi:hypothetical protein